VKILKTDGQGTFSQANSLSMIEYLYHIHVCITLSNFVLCVHVNKCYVEISRYNVSILAKNIF